MLSAKPSAFDRNRAAFSSVSDAIRTTPFIISVTDCAAVAACPTDRLISCVVALCSSIAAAIAVDTWSISPILPPILATAFAVSSGRTLDLGDLLADVLGRFRGLTGKLLHLGRDDGKAPAGFACARCLDGGIQCKKVGLARDISDQRGDLSDALHLGPQFGDRPLRRVAFVHRSPRGIACPVDPVGNLPVEAANSWVAADTV